MLISFWPITGPPRPLTSTISSYAQFLTIPIHQLKLIDLCRAAAFISINPHGGNGRAALGMCLSSCSPVSELIGGKRFHPGVSIVNRIERESDLAVLDTIGGNLFFQFEALSLGCSAARQVKVADLVRPRWQLFHGEHVTPRNVDVTVHCCRCSARERELHIDIVVVASVVDRERRVAASRVDVVSWQIACCCWPFGAVRRIRQCRRRLCDQGRRRHRRRRWQR